MEKRQCFRVLQKHELGGSGLAGIETPSVHSALVTTHFALALDFHFRVRFNIKSES